MEKSTKNPTPLPENSREAAAKKKKLQHREEKIEQLIKEIIELRDGKPSDVLVRDKLRGLLRFLSGLLLTNFGEWRDPKDLLVNADDLSEVSHDESAQ